MVNENIVLDYYLQLMADDEIEFLVGRDNSKASIIACINALKEAESMHQKIEIAKDLWKLLFEASMSYIDKDKHGYDSLFTYFDEYVEFEELIFASDSFYRDHTIHCLWVYFLGEYLYRKEEFSSIFRDMMESYKMFCDILLTFVDELEEFSRISRANQNRQYINQFCRTDLYAAEGWLCVDFIFDNKDIEDLNPEIAFRGRCKRLLSLFDIPKLDESVKIRMRCIGQLPSNENEYMLEIRKNYANITVNGEERNIPEYLRSRHFYSKDELAVGSN